ncbi:MMPL family transporter [Microbacterium sp. NC79]|uniref:MMPL family transporter n=1 Tax=Microbacterium sp. NC79 TaxID=2851009 RepID=UPI001C2C5C78|nr:MMPL family transporter [Microbacterium sp. NC79]MBV0894750.1 MMPL family transporter [Microbacterium sp. NC79]
MAELLYRLGRFSARRAWAVIVGWLVILGLAGGAFLAFGGALATSFSIPNTETERVSDQLADTFPELTGASATVVFATDDGSAFTETQQADIAALLSNIASFEGVAGVTDPFAVEQLRAQQAAALADGQTQIDAGKAQLDASTTQLDAGQAQLDAGRAQLEAAIAAAQADGTYPAAQPVFDAQLAGLAEEQAKIDAGRAQIETGTTELAAQQSTVADGQTLVDLSANLSMVSESGTTAMGAVQFDEMVYTLPDELKADVREALDGATISGVSIDYSATITMSVDGLIGVGEIVGVLIAALVLIIMMRAFLPAVTPLLSSIVGVGVGVAGSLAFSGVVDMASVTPVLGVMLGLAVGIDYSLFILNRHRRQLMQGIDVEESIGLANGTAGNAVVFAGTTVIVALAALLVTGIPFLGVMGIVAAACVAIAVLVSITFTPALLGLMKLRVLSKRKRALIGVETTTQRPLKAMRVGRSLVAATVGVAALLMIAIPALSMRLGLPDGSSEPVESTQYQAYNIVADEFGAGQNGTLLVVATFDEPIDEAAQLATQASIGTQLGAQDDVAAVAPVAVSTDSTVFAFQVIPTDGPTSEATETLVHTLRGLDLTEDATLGVAGQATGNIDVSEKLQDALPVYLVVVIGLSLIIMILVFRSILVPVIATAGYVLSLFAALGAVTAIYQWGWLASIFDVHSPAPVLSFAPIIIMGVLFGLAMDYQLFLVSGMREAFVHGVPAREAVVAGLRNGRAVVTAAAIIMISVFGGFVFSHLTMVRPLGFGLAIGVLFDAFVVRMVIVPAIMTALGKSAWWLPRWLDRIMPDVDVEGASLERTHSAPKTDADDEANDPDSERELALNS